MQDIIKMLDYRLAAQNGDQIMSKRLEEKDAAMAKKLASVRKLMRNAHFTALLVLFAAAVLVIADLTANRMATGASLVGLVLVSEACGIELSYSVWKRNLSMVISWAVFNVLCIVLLLLLVGAAF